MPMFEFLAHRTFVLRERDLQPITLWLRERGRRVTWEAALARRHLFATRTRVWLRDFDLLVTPTMPSLPPPVGAWSALDPETALMTAARLGVFTAAFNAGGQPAISVPTWGEGGALPIGVQLVGRHHDDARLLSVARTLLEALGDAPSRSG
jgi:amidase